MPVSEIAIHEPAAASRGSSSRTWRRWLFPPLAALIVFGIARGTDYYTNDHVLNSFPAGRQGVHVVSGQTIYFGLYAFSGIGLPDTGRTVDLRSAFPRVLDDTTDASVTVMTCAGTGKQDELTMGGVVADATPFCTSIHNFRAGEVALGYRAAGLVLRVTPLHSGVIHIAGVDVRYNDGLRAGHQQIGPDITLTAGR